MSEPKKVGRRTFLNYATAIVATGVIVGAATYLATPKGATTTVTVPAATTTVTVPGAATTVTAPGATTTVTAPVTPIGPKYKFVWIVWSTADPFFNPALRGLDDFAKQFGCEVQKLGPPTNVQDNAMMVHMMETAIANKVDGIGLMISDPTAFNDVTQKALDAGIPVFGFNCDSESNPRLGFIGANPAVQGQITGKRIVSMYKPGDRIGHLGYPGLEHVEIRRKEATKIMEAAGLIVDTIPVTAEEQADKAKMSDKIRSYILAHPDVRHLNGFGSIDTCAIAVTVANLGKAAGAKPAEGKITVGGYDLMPEILNAIKAGNATWTVADYPYLQGYCTMLALWLNKQSHGVIKFDMNTGASFCDASNIDAYLAEKYYI